MLIPFGGLLLAQIPFLLWQRNWKKQRTDELGASRPRFGEFFDAYIKERDKARLKKALAIAGVLGAIAISVAAAAAKEQSND